MHKVNIANLDGGLLIALNALLEEKNVTKAAKRINLSQPATSRALGRLREIFQDPLLVKGAKGMVLTARASALYQPLQHILNGLGDLLSSPATQPIDMQGEIVIATRDYELAVILPSVIKQLTMQAPNLRLRVIPLAGDDLNVLENHHADFVLTGSDSKAATLHRQTVYQENFACLTAKNTVISKQGMTLQRYLQAKHCLVTISGHGLGVVDSILLQKNQHRNIAVRVPHFLAVGQVIANTDLVVTLPKRLGELLAKQNDLVLTKSPVSIPNFSVYLYWHTFNHHNPVHQWVRKLIKESVAGW